MEKKSKEQPESEMPKRTNGCLGRPVIRDDIAGLGANMQLRERTCRELKVKRNPICRREAESEFRERRRAKRVWRTDILKQIF